MATNESIEPSIPNTRILLWVDLNCDDSEEISKTEFVPDIERILGRALNIEGTEPRRSVLLELYTNMVLYCKEQKYDKEQISVLLSILKNVHQLNTETSLNNMDQCFTYCSELLLCHSVHRPPFSVQLFKLHQVTDIMKYVVNTYIRHFMLYKYIFTPQMHLDLSLSYSGIPEEPESEQPPVCESDNQTEMEADRSTEQSKVSTDILVTETEVATPAAKSPKNTIRTIIQEEVKAELMRLTTHLEKRLQESNDHLNAALSAQSITSLKKK